MSYKFPDRAPGFGTGPAGDHRDGWEAYPQLAAEAAAVMESEARFHPLIDRNKGTAWTLMVLMLWINGYRHDFGTEEAFNLVVGLAAGEVTLEDSAGTIAAHLLKC